MIVKLLTEHHLEFLSLKGDCTGSSESTLVKISNCWKSHALAQLGLNPYATLPYSLRQVWLIKCSFFIHSTTPYIHPWLDSRIEPKFSNWECPRIL